MLKDAEENKYDAILVTDLSRLARNRKFLNKISKIFESKGIQIIKVG
jgi:DNA invertase Pin-like site-specific DNA recombinase